MHILIISQYFPPEPGFHISSLARDLVKRGHQVTVLTGFPNYPLGHMYPGYKQRLWQHEKQDGVDILRLWLYVDHSESRLKRMLNYLSFTLSACLLGPLLLSLRADIIYVYSPPLTTGLGDWFSNGYTNPR